jgi:hypothetical protein
MTIAFTDEQAAATTTRTDTAPTARLRALLAILFSLLFMVLSISFAALAVKEFIAAISNLGSLTTGLVASINAAVISLAAFELGLNVGKEYIQESDDDIFAAVRRSIARFVGVVCIALVLEGLIMVIKYSQLELAGNLGYPVAIIGSASLLLIALGLFLFLTRPERRLSDREVVERRIIDSATVSQAA